MTTTARLPALPGVETGDRVRLTKDGEVIGWAWVAWVGEGVMEVATDEGVFPDEPCEISAERVGVTASPRMTTQAIAAVLRRHGFCAAKRGNPTEENPLRCWARDGFRIHYDRKRRNLLVWFEGEAKEGTTGVEPPEEEGEALRGYLEALRAEGYAPLLWASDTLLLPVPEAEASPTKRRVTSKRWRCKPFPYPKQEGGLTTVTFRLPEEAIHMLNLAIDALDPPSRDELGIYMVDLLYGGVGITEEDPWEKERAERRTTDADHDRHEG